MNMLEVGQRQCSTQVGCNPDRSDLVLLRRLFQLLVRQVPMQPAILGVHQGSNHGGILAEKQRIVHSKRRCAHVPAFQAGLLLSLEHMWIANVLLSLINVFALILLPSIQVKMRSTRTVPVLPLHHMQPVTLVARLRVMLAAVALHPKLQTFDH